MIEKELEAQLSIVRALKPLSPASQARVLKAFGHILEADMLVPGVFDQFVRGGAATDYPRRKMQSDEPAP